MLRVPSPSDPHKSKDWDLLSNVLKTVPTTQNNAAKTIRDNTEALFAHKSLSNSPSKRGSWFELCTIDGLIQAGVNPNRIDPATQVIPARNVEADIIVWPTVRSDIDAFTFFWMLKTSIRERWKQWDRDAGELHHALGIYNPFIIGLFFDEHPRELKWDKKKNMELAADKRRQCANMNRLLTIKDDDGVNRIINEILRY